jgi:hypothetical protein
VTPLSVIKSQKVQPQRSLILTHSHSFSLIRSGGSAGWAREPLLHHPRRALAQERAHRRADLARVANEFVILIRPQPHDDAHCAAALAVHVSHWLPPAGSARSAAGRVTRSPTYSPRYAPHPLSLPQGPFSIRPWRGSNETLCGLSTMRRKAVAAIKRKPRNGRRVRRHRKSLPVRVRGVGEVGVPGSEIERCVPLATSWKNRFSHNCAPGMAIISAMMIPPLKW